MMKGFQLSGKGSRLPSQDIKKDQECLNGIRIVPGTSDSDSEEEDDRLGDPVRISKDEKFSLMPSVSGGLGTVIMNLQQTAQDGKMTLRLFGKSDEILRMLLPELGFGLSIVKPPVWPKMSRALVP